MTRRNKTVRLKVQGSPVAVEELIAVLEKVFPLIIKGPIVENDRDRIIHVFLNLSPFLTNEEVLKE